MTQGVSDIFVVVHHRMDVSGSNLVIRLWVVISIALQETILLAVVVDGREFLPAERVEEHAMFLHGLVLFYSIAPTIFIVVFWTDA
jgi:hypothetical protein